MGIPRDRRTDEVSDGFGNGRMEETQMVRLKSWARPQALHTFTSSKKCRCDGKGCFEVVIRKHRLGEEIKYWCNVKRGYFNPFNVTECDRWQS